MAVSDLVFIDPTGYHFSDFPTFLDYYQTSYRAIYGADVYLEPDSQDGQFVALQAQAAFDCASLGGSVFNSFSPSTAQGVGLSRNVKINGLNRHIPSFSTVTLTIVGQAGTVITNGIATDGLNQQWLLPSPTTIPGGGTISVLATAQFTGAVGADANTITTIFTPTRGWQTVNNSAAATQGAPVETDAELRVRQSLSTADPAQTILDATIGGVFNVTGVTKVRGYENDTGSTDANGIPAHKFSIIAVGGTNSAVAQEIQLRKTPGTGTFGNTSVLVYDAHGMPLTISFGRPTTVTIQATVTITALPSFSNDFIALIQQSMADTINAGRIGDDILYTKLFSPAYLSGTTAGQSYDVDSLTIGKNSGMQGTSNISLLYNENPVCVAGTDITVIVA